MLCLPQTTQTIAVTPCRHPDPICETCYQKVTFYPLCRALFDNRVSPLDESEQSGIYNWT